MYKRQSEATAIGNVMVQALAAGAARDIASMRQLINRSIPLKTFYPQDIDVYKRQSYNPLYGKIISDWHIDERCNFKLNVEIPVNTSATIVLPQWGKECAKEPIQVLSGSYLSLIHI